MKKHTRIAAAIIAAMTMATSMVGISASANAVLSQPVPYGNTKCYSTTFTGYYQYVQEIAVVYHINLSLSSSPAVTVKSLGEIVTLKNGAGDSLTPISASATYADHVSTSTPTFSGNTYTHKGTYAYSVDSSNYAYGMAGITWSATII